MMREYIAEPLANNATPAAKVWLPEFYRSKPFIKSASRQLGTIAHNRHVQVDRYLDSSAKVDLSEYGIQAITTFERCRGWLEGTLQVSIPE